MVVLKNIGPIEFLAILIESEDLISMFVACGRNGLEDIFWLWFVFEAFIGIVMGPEFAVAKSI